MQLFPKYDVQFSCRAFNKAQYQRTNPQVCWIYFFSSIYFVLSLWPPDECMDVQYLLSF